MTYWSFRMMIFFGLAAGAVALLALWATRGNRTPTSKLLLWGALTLPILPLLANSFGWIFTEMGRQPGSSSARCSPATASPAASRSSR